MLYLVYIHLQYSLCKTKNGFQDQISLNAGQKNCRMFKMEHSAILSTFIKLPVVIKTFILSSFERSLYTGFTVTLVVDKKRPLKSLRRRLLSSRLLY